MRSKLLLIFSICFFALAVSSSTAIAKHETLPPRDCSAKTGNALESCKYHNYVDKLDRSCKSNTPYTCIRFAATIYHQDYFHAIQVASRESTFNRYASNGSHFGLFQFDWDTWQGSPYDDDGSVFSARYNSLAAMWYWARGETSRWAQTY